MCRGVQFLLFLFIATLGDEYSRVVIRGSKSMLSPANKLCIIPHNKDYHYFTNEVDILNPGESIKGDGKFVVSAKCYNSRKIIKPSDFAVCFDGKLYPSHHTCELIPEEVPVQKKCAPKYDSYSTIFSCTTPKGDEVSCQLPAEPGTKLTILCAHWRYKPPAVAMLRERFCLQNGEWEKYKDCASQCGLPSEKDDLSSHTNKFKVVHWKAVIFVYKKNVWTFLCRAGVISNVLVITASTCFGNITSWGAFPQKVGVGKYSRNYYDYLSTNMYNVGQIYKLQHSITIVGVDAYIEFSDTVGSICIGDTLDSDARRAVLLPERTKLMSNEKCQSLEGIDKKIGTNELCYKYSTTSDREIIGNVFYKYDNASNTYKLVGILSDMFPDKRIGVFSDVRWVAISNFITRKTQEFDQWLLKNHNGWWRRRQ